MKTISERIEAAIDEALGDSWQPSLRTVARILKEHFCEPWLDAPDGPGWWWIEGFGVLSTTNIRQDQFDCGYWVRGYKWQRVIGPSE